MARGTLSASAAELPSLFGATVHTDVATEGAVTAFTGWAVLGEDVAGAVRFVGDAESEVERLAQVLIANLAAGALWIDAVVEATGLDAGHSALQTRLATIVRDTVADFTFGQGSSVEAFDGVATEVAGFSFFAAATSEWIAILWECAAEVYRASFREVYFEITLPLAWAVGVADAGFAASTLFFAGHLQAAHTVGAAVITIADFADDRGSTSCTPKAPSLE